jgi:hypothetical protein
MTVDEAYTALSAKITSDVIRQETDNWPTYFEGLRDVTKRVVVTTAESGLSDEDKAALLKRLLDHIADLEKWWPSLKPDR